MKKHDLPQDIQNRIDRELLSNENLIWVGQPHPSRFLNVQANKTHPLLSLVIVTEIFLFILALIMSELLLAGLLFLALVLTAILGGLAQQLSSAKNTIYAVTNQRAMIIEGNNVQTFRKRDLQSITKTTRKTGRGDIIFRKDSEMRLRPSGFGFMLQRRDEKEIGFLGIEHPDHVEALLLNTFAEESSLSIARLEDINQHDENESDNAYRSEAKNYMSGY